MAKPRATTSTGSDTAMVILVAGLTGAGKTTAARALANQYGGVRFSIDEWMMRLFWSDSPQPIEFDWTMERIARCEAMIWDMAQICIARGCPAILDLGFTTRDHRQSFYDRAAAAGLRAGVVFVDVPADERWRRVQQRNVEQGATYAMQVDRAMFDFMETRWEPVASSEPTMPIGIEQSADAP